MNTQFWVSPVYGFYSGDETEGARHATQAEIDAHLTPTTEELLTSIRIERNALLAECDWTQLPDAPLTNNQKQAWHVYRQDLRDFPETCDPVNPVWPTRPE